MSRNDHEGIDPFDVLFDAANGDATVTSTPQQRDDEFDRIMTAVENLSPGQAAAADALVARARADLQRPIQAGRAPDIRYRHVIPPPGYGGDGNAHPLRSEAVNVVSTVGAGAAMGAVVGKVSRRRARGGAVAMVIGLAVVVIVLSLLPILILGITMQGVTSSVATAGNLAVMLRLAWRAGKLTQNSLRSYLFCFIKERERKREKL